MPSALGALTNAAPRLPYQIYYVIKIPWVTLDMKKECCVVIIIRSGGLSFAQKVKYGSRMLLIIMKQNEKVVQSIRHS